MTAIAPVAACDFDRLLLGETAGLLRYARRLAGTLVDAEDLVQETLLRCWRSRGTFQPGSNIGCWARTVMRNAFISGLRRHRHEVDVDDEVAHRLHAIPPAQEAAAELSETLRAVERLPDGPRAALRMSLEGVSMEDGAARLAVPLNTYKSWLHRGRLRLSGKSSAGKMPAAFAVTKLICPSAGQ